MNKKKISTWMESLLLNWVAILINVCNIVIFVIFLQLLEFSMDRKYCWTAWGSGRNRYCIEEGSCLPFCLFPVSEQALALTRIMVVSLIAVSKGQSRFIILRGNFSAEVLYSTWQCFLRESRSFVAVKFQKIPETSCWRKGSCKKHSTLFASFMLSSVDFF